VYIKAKNVALVAPNLPSSPARDMALSQDLLRDAQSRAEADVIDQKLEIAGRVNVKNVRNETILIHPYMDKSKNPPVQPPDVLLRITKDTVYSWSPVITGSPEPTFQSIKEGSWVRVTYADGKISKIVIHTKPRARGRTPDRKP
jgi:hypothetical protein